MTREATVGGLREALHERHHPWYMHVGGNSSNYRQSMLCDVWESTTRL